MPLFAGSGKIKRKHGNFGIGTFNQLDGEMIILNGKPYPPLAEVTKNQPEFNFADTAGTIVGFRCPAFVKGVNVPGCHFHFLSDDAAKGGHILDFILEEGICEIDLCHRYLLILPEEGKGLEHLDLSRDRSKELEAVEK